MPLPLRLRLRHDHPSAAGASGWPEGGWSRLAIAGLALVVAAAAGVGAWLWVDSTGPNGASASRAAARATARSTTTTSTTSTTTTTVPPTTTTTVPPTTTTTVDPGSLPQTDALPSADTPEFNAEMAALWQGIVTDSTTTAMPAFFPESAYVQLKTIAGPQYDFTNRLVYDYGLDIGAAHGVLGPDAASAQLTSVDVDAAYAHWVPPGVCDNSIGYFEVPNSRIVYQEDGQTRSFGIASMISWRGVWYVVHLGAILRSSDDGVVEDPELGAGTPTPSSTC